MEGVGCWDNDIVTDFVREVITVSDAALLFDCVIVNAGVIVRLTNGVADWIGDGLGVGVS